MNTIGQVAKVTVLLLLCCTEQGNSQIRSRTRSTTTTQSYEDYLKEKKAKSLYFEYYPNYGYEPYWVDGQWVLSTKSTTQPPYGKTTTKPPKVCGEPCNYLFQRIKEVCARWATNEDDWKYGCGNVWWDYASSVSCTGRFGIDLTGLFRTYETYCQFLKIQCKKPFQHLGRLILVHIGKCKPFHAVDDGNGYFGTLWHAERPLSRQKFYLSSLNPPNNTV